MNYFNRKESVNLENNDEKENTTSEEEDQESESEISSPKIKSI